jgi:hypothetical protein
MTEQLESPFLDAELFEAEAPARTGPFIVVESDKDQLLAAGEYAFHQGKIVEQGKFSDKMPGQAHLGKIDPGEPFIFEVRDRVCAIRTGAFFNPGDPAIQYGGTWFDWTYVRDNRQPEKNFWPYYQREMDYAAIAEAFESPTDRRIDRFLQHEHIVRRPIRIAKPFLSQLSKVRLRATPARIRVGPFVRYTDHERAVVWLETVTPSMVRVCFRRSGAAKDAPSYATTVRVGGRYFAAVELKDLAPHIFYDYTVQLAPLPASGIPAPNDVAAKFPPLTPAVLASMRQQCTTVALNKNTEWLTFRTLQARYDRLRFATGSCRWYPGDKEKGKDWGPDMLAQLGSWLKLTSKTQWPEFLFLGGDQIYSDQIGDDHAAMIISSRFAARLPGPSDATTSARQKLIDGAWAGRFAHRYLLYKEYKPEAVQRIEKALEQLDRIHKEYPVIQGIALEYPDADPTEKLKWRHQLFKTKRGSARLEADDERKVREALERLPTLKNLEISTEIFRPFVPHWRAGFGIAVRRNPMVMRYLVHNFLLWSVPTFEEQLPSIAAGSGQPVVRKPDLRGHPSAAGGVHAADFAEYGYLYERAWTWPPTVRTLLAHVPTFLMFDDHETTDDWNADATWARMLQNPKDDFRMWPKTLTDALAAYWVYQGWCNRAPSQWKADPRAKALFDAARDGTDALPELRKIIHDACFVLKPKAEGTQTGCSLDWHYKLPFEPPFLVPDCRTRRLMVPSDEALRDIDHDVPAKAPKSMTIDRLQLDWLRKELLTSRSQVAFVATSTPLLLQKKVTSFMASPRLAAGAWARGVDVVSGLGLMFESKKLLVASSTMLDRLFRFARDLEHMIRDKTWSDLWGLADAMRKARSPVKTLVFVSGDVHHSYSMTANLPGGPREKPELLQITCSGFQTTIRKDFQTRLAERISTKPFNVGRYRHVPGFVSKGGTGAPDLILYENSWALVDVNVAAEVAVTVTYFAAEKPEHQTAQHIFQYTSGPAYMLNGVPAVLERHLQRGPAMAR